jgi:hypothetical protein
MKTGLKQLQALFVTWQHEPSRRYYPVGRLVSGLGPELPEYEFVYLRGVGVAQKVGFDPLLAFAELDRVYRSDDLFPLFQNRLMSPGRPEFREFASSLAVDPGSNDPMPLLVRSGGGRATDSLEMFEVPRISEEGNPYQTHFLAHGIRYLHSTSLERIQSLKPDDQLRIFHDCQNPADPNALALRTEDRIIVGYMPRYLIGDAVQLLNSCEIVEAFVAQVNSSAPLQQRLLCRMEACWPPDFRPFCDKQYKPIPQDATDLSAWCRGD